MNLEHTSFWVHMLTCEMREHGAVSTLEVKVVTTLLSPSSGSPGIQLCLQENLILASI